MALSNFLGHLNCLFDNVFSYHAYIVGYLHVDRNRGRVPSRVHKKLGPKLLTVVELNLIFCACVLVDIRGLFVVQGSNGSINVACLGSV